MNKRNMRKLQENIMKNVKRSLIEANIPDLHQLKKTMDYEDFDDEVVYENALIQVVESYDYETKDVFYTFIWKANGFDTELNARRRGEAIEEAKERMCIVLENKKDCQRDGIWID